MSQNIVNFPGASLRAEDARFTTFYANNVSMHASSGLEQITSVGHVTTTGIEISNIKPSTSTTTGALVVSGGVGIAGNVNVGGNVTTVGQVITTGLEISQVKPSTSTTTGALVVNGGVGMSGNVNVGGNATITENLTVRGGTMELTQVANTFQIKSSSNVVTEYTRSKKLIKYPRVAMTAATTAGYTASASTTFGFYSPFLAFDNNITDTAGTTLWTSADSTYDSNDNYAYSSNKSLGGVSGEWLKIQLPVKIRPEYVQIYPRTYSPPVGNNQSPEDFVFLASNDDTNWVQLGSVTGWVTNATWGRWPIPSQTSYKYYAMVCTRTIGSALVGLAEMEIYGTPEYDPEAHGADVIVRSVPNVPNTDWLEVYYDGQDYTSMPPTVTDKSGNGVTGTPSGGVGFDTEYKAFTFDGSGDIRSTVSTFSGDQPHTMSVWAYISDALTTADAYICVLAPSTGEALDQVSTIRFQNNGFNMQSWGNDIQMYNLGIPKDRWYHLTAVYDGGGVTTSSKRLYIDGVQNLSISTDATSGNTINFTNTTLSLGSRVDGAGSHLKGSIANFRLFNRALTEDEVWQLYAYQKEYFNVSSDVVTFKGGRLGIGTTEPRAVLDVRGDAKFNFAYRELLMYSRPTAWIYNSSGTSLTLPYNTSGDYIYFTFPNYYSTNFEPIIKNDYRYYVPENGLYFVRFTPQGAGGNYYEWFINKNRNSRNNNDDINYRDGFGPYAGYNGSTSGTISAVIPMTTADYITFGIYTTGTTFNMGTRSSACITLIQRF